MTGPVVIAEAPADTAASDIGRLARADLSSVVFVPGTTLRTAGGVGADVLTALGKSSDVNGKARHGYDDVILAPIWLTAHRTTTMYAAAPQHTPVDYLLDLADMLAASPTTLWLACDHGYAERLAISLAALRPTLAPWPSLPDEQPGSDTPADTAAPTWDGQARSVLPDTEFFTFYDTARDLLTDDQFAAVDRLYQQALTRTLSWLEQTGSDKVTEDATLAALSTLLAEQTTLDEINVATKAAQVAFFRTGWHLSVDQRELRSGLLRFPHPDVGHPTWRVIRAYRDTARAATVALYLTGLTPQQIKDMTIADLTAWHADPTTPIRDRVIPEEAAPYLRAHLLARISDAPASTDPVFLGSDRRVLLDLREAGVDLGLNLGEANLDPAERHSVRRVNSRVFRLTRLT